jgi:TonB family protein
LFPGQELRVDPPEGGARPSAPPPPVESRRRGGGGEGGEGGTFEDIHRFLLDKRFDNPEGGLVTGLGRTLYYNDKGADFVPWIRRMLAEVRRNFMMPYSAAFMAGHVAVGVVVLRSGDVAELQVLIPSGTAGFDNAAVGALRAADLLPLPADYPDQQFEFILVFWINERPYDLF